MTGMSSDDGEVCGIVMCDPNYAITDNLRGFVALGDAVAAVKAADVVAVGDKLYVDILSVTVTVTYDGTAHTITRAAGSWITDGFTVGMRPTSSGTASNNATHSAITAVTALVLTVASGLTTEASVSATITVPSGKLTNTASSKRASGLTLNGKAAVAGQIAFKRL
jgi:hypothetical protein